MSRDIVFVMHCWHKIGCTDTNTNLKLGLRIKQKVDNLIKEIIYFTVSWGLYLQA